MAQVELFAAEPQAAARLTAWAPDQWEVASDWHPVVSSFLAGTASQTLGCFITDRLLAGAAIYPPRPWRALELTALADVRVVILGQDPYHGAGQAEGLAFSVAPGMRLPPSLRNIYLELGQDPALAPWPVPTDGSLVHWARQGVLLLNTCLTVEEGQPASHANHGWEVLTDQIIRAVRRRPEPVVFMLWGAHAQRAAAAAGLDGASAHHLLLTANHPSPLSARRGPQPFLGCRHFSRANAFLRQLGQPPIRW